MSIRIEAIYTTPVKSLALNRVESARVGKRGIEGDRAFFLIDAEGKLLTQRQHPALVQVTAAYDPSSDRLTLTLPGGRTVDGIPADEPAGARDTNFHGHAEVPGVVTGAPFAEALSAFADMPIRLVRASRGGAFDALPLSICSRASLQALASAAGSDDVDERRFRQNVWVSGTGPHEEDDWIGSDVRLGTAVARVIMRDGRCVMTTQNPDTGTQDMDTLKLIASYRTDQPKEVNFGVYAGVVTPGEIAVGHEVIPGAVPAE